MFPIKLEDIKTVITRSIGPDVQIIDHQVHPFTKSRQFGIMGNHYELIVEIKYKPNSETTRCVSFFVKTPPDSAAIRNTLVDDWVTYEEIHFFEKIYPLMMEVFKDAEQWSPVCYLAKVECLVMENIRPQGYAVRNSRNFSENDLKAVLATLARFHAASLLLERKLGKSLSEMFPRAFREKVFTNVGKGGRCNKLGFDTMQWMAERFGLDGGIVPRILDRLVELVKPRKNGCNVICHGDLWRSNIMLSDSPSLSCLLVDYQMLRYASPTVDVAMLLFVRTTPEFRQSSELKMLKHYHSILQETLGMDPETVPTYESILEDYQQRKLIGMAYSALRWPPIVFSDVLSDPVALEGWYFHDRLSVYRKAMQEDPHYEAQMREYLVELFDEAKRVLGLM